MQRCLVLKLTQQRTAPVRRSSMTASRPPEEQAAQIGQEYKTARYGRSFSIGSERMSGSSAALRMLSSSDRRRGQGNGSTQPSSVAACILSRIGTKKSPERWQRNAGKKIHRLSICFVLRNIAVLLFLKPVQNGTFQPKKQNENYTQFF